MSEHEGDLMSDYPPEWSEEDENLPQDIHDKIQANMEAARHTPEYEQEGRELKASEQPQLCNKCGYEVAGIICTHCGEPISEQQEWTLQEYANTNAAHILSGGRKINSRAIPYDSAAEIVAAHTAALAAERDAFAAKNPTSFVRIELVGELLVAERDAIKVACRQMQNTLDAVLTKMNVSETNNNKKET